MICRGFMPKHEQKYYLELSDLRMGRLRRLVITPFRLRLGVGLLFVLLIGAIGTTWGFFHYRGEYMRTEAIRLENARFEQERATIISKVTRLETSVERVERFANRVEAVMPAQAPTMSKGIGPIHSELNTPIISDLSPSTHWLTSDKSTHLFTENVELKLNQLGAVSDLVGMKLQEMYETRQDVLAFDAAVPSVWPVNGWVTSVFGPRRRPMEGATAFHQGIDIAAPYGTPIRAPADGIVTYAGYRSGYGNVLVVDHGFGMVTSYGHASQFLAREGDLISRGQMVALVGRTGSATGTHLHFEVVVDGLPVDPMTYLPKRFSLAKK